MIEPISNNEIEKFTLQKPPLYKRLFSGLIDVLFFAILFFGLEIGSFYSVFRALGYESAIETIQNMYKDSHLFNYSDENGYRTKLEEYDEEESVLVQLDEPIIYYYSSDSRALSDRKLETYNIDKIDSGHFELVNNELTLITSLDNEKLYEFLENEYNEALNYFYSNPEYIRNNKLSYSIILYGSLIILLLSSSIYYILIPMLTKYRVTLGELFFKFALANSNTDKLATRKDVLYRNVVFIVFNILSTFLLFLVLEYIAFIPIAITILMLSFTKKGLTPHDYMSNTYLVTIDSLINNLHDKKDDKKESKKEYKVNHI